MKVTSGSSLLFTVHNLNGFEQVYTFVYICMVMSSSLCENMRDAVKPLFIELVKDRKENAIHAFDDGTPASQS
jgi:DNA phosphorothioation-dependent restriction protein DptG